MIRTLLWKEYREQRATVLALVALAIGLLVCVQTFGEPSNSDSSPFGMIAACLVWMTGLIVGAQPFAGEIENRTLAWLDSQPARRREIGRTKFAFAVCATIAQAALLILIGVTTGWIEERHFAEGSLIIVGLGLSGLGCGLWGSTLGSSGLVAVGWALLIQGAVFIVALGVAALFRTVSNQPLNANGALFAAVLCLPVPFIAASRRFNRLDRLRRSGHWRFGIGQSWRALIWLAWRQSRLVFWGLAIAGLFAAVLLSFGDLWQYWPPVGLAFGIIAGVGAFAADRPGEAFRFLGDRRPPLGQVWIVKAGMRMVAALAPWLVYVAVILSKVLIESYQRAETGDAWKSPYIQRLWSGLESGNLVIGPLYGFALGVFLGMVCRKGAVAVVLAAMLGCFVLLVWWPSIIITGLHIWQWIAPPLVLIGATCFVMRPWTSGRLANWRPSGGLAAAFAFSLVAMLGGLWYRVLEVPVRNDPFDVAAFVASLPTPEQNVAGRKIAVLLRSFPDPGSSHHELRPDGEVRLTAFGRAGEAVNKQIWPADDAELNRWLDEFIANPWFGELREALVLPLGMIEGLQTTGELREYASTRNASFAGTILNARALQLGRRNKPGEAFDSLFAALALSRHLRSKATWQTLQVANTIEYSSLTLLPVLAESAASQPDLLTLALSRLRAHDAAIPPFGDTLRIDYCNSLVQVSPSTWGIHRSPGQPSIELLRLAAQVPWEWGRTKGILATLFAGYIRTSELSFRDAITRIALPTESNNFAPELRIWTPPSIEADRARSEYLRIRDLVRYSIWFEFGVGSADFVFGREIGGKTHRRGAELQLALMVYPIRHGNPAAALADLVPGILPELPRDPYSDESFHYRVSDGERIRKWPLGPDQTEYAYWTIPAGQGIVWSVGPDLQNNGGTINCYAGWSSRNNAGDVIFLVPRLSEPRTK